MVKNRKLSWPQTFFGAFQRLVPTTRRQRSVHPVRTLYDSAIDRYAIGMYAAELGTQRHPVNRPTSCPKAQKIEAVISADIEGKLVASLK